MMLRGNPDNWNVPQTVTVAAAKDNFDDVEGIALPIRACTNLIPRIKCHELSTTNKVQRIWK
jgi:hypothetical protein